MGRTTDASTVTKRTRTTPKPGPISLSRKKSGKVPLISALERKWTKSLFQWNSLDPLNTTEYDIQELKSLEKDRHFQSCQRYWKKHNTCRSNERKGNQDTRFPLIEAAIANDAECIAKLYQSKASPFERDHENATALHWAAYFGNLDALKALLQHPRTDVDVRTITGETPIMWAAFKGHVETVRYLLRWARVDIQDKRGRLTVMHHAALGGNVEVMKVLAPEINFKKYAESHSALHFAAKKGHMDMCKYLLSQKVAKSKYAFGTVGTLDSSTARIYHHEEVAKYLEEKGY